MPTNIIIDPADRYVLVTTTDNYKSPEGLITYSTVQQVLKPGDKALVTYATTTRSIEVRDLDPDDSRTGNQQKTKGDIGAMKAG